MFLLFLSALQMYQVSLNSASNRKVGLLEYVLMEQIILNVIQASKTMRGIFGVFFVSIRSVHNE